jgi:hypothetical protein
MENSLKLKLSKCNYKKKVFPEKYKIETHLNRRMEKIYPINEDILHPEEYKS